MSFYALSSRRSAAGSDYRLAGTMEGVFWICTLTRGEGVPTLFEALKPEAQEDLVRDHLIEILTVIEKVVPNPPTR